jgi:hypothetical protein
MVARDYSGHQATSVGRQGWQATRARLVIPVFNEFIFWMKKMFLPGFLRIIFLCFPEEFFTGTWF